MKLDKVIERIRKLRAFSRENSTEGEAFAAAAMAQRLLAEHQLTEEQVAAGTTILQVDVMPLVRREEFLPWEQLLLIGCAKANSCEVVTDKHCANCGEVVSAMVTGRETFARAGAALFQLLHPEVQRLGAARFAQAGADGLHDYMLGLAGQVGQRLDTERRAVWVGQKELAVYDAAAKAAEEYCQGTATRQYTPVEVRDEASYAQGEAAANALDTGRGRYRGEEQRALPPKESE
jgi:hypothetical protein